MPTDLFGWYQLPWFQTRYHPETASDSLPHVPAVLRIYGGDYLSTTWWRHQIKTFSAWLAICAGNSPVPGEFPAHSPATWSFGVFDLRLNKWLSKQWWGWWFETSSPPLWRHRNEYEMHRLDCGKHKLSYPWFSVECNYLFQALTSSMIK